jgi:hypothetical protein
MLFPIGIQNFEKIRKGGYVYVDKTALLYEMANSGSYYFLSRPRRFGKSLLLSTLEAYFLGQKDLFKGLAIEQLEKEWTVYPVLHIDFNIARYDTEASLLEKLDVELSGLEETQHVDGPQLKDVGLRFERIVKRAFQQTGHQVVILVDEYDKPMLATIGNEELQKKYRDILQGFYSIIKSCDAYIRFAFLTGVTKFGQLSVFSGMNNPDDISMDSHYADLCGISEEELHTYFDADIKNLAEDNGLTYELACQKLKDRYDGYHFTNKKLGVYNPFSLLNAFKKSSFGSYWFATGTPTYLVQLLKTASYDLNELYGDIYASEVDLNSFDGNNNLVGAFYQSGYLTIKDFDGKYYRLGIPNGEVGEGFTEFLVPYYAGRTTGNDIRALELEVEAGNPDAFLTRIRRLLASVAADMQPNQVEHNYRNMLFLLFKVTGVEVHMEEPTSAGRIDMVVRTDKYVYVMEFKLNQSAEKAMRQITDKHYADSYLGGPQQVFRIGVNFAEETRNIDDWTIEKG